MSTIAENLQESAAAARRQVAHYTCEAEEAEGRARELRQLASTAGPGREADDWRRQAEFLDQVAGAHRRQAAEYARHLAYYPTTLQASSAATGGAA